MPDQAAHMTAFRQLVYQRPDLTFVENQLRRARLRLRLAMNPESAAAAVSEMQQVQKDYRTAGALAFIQSGRHAAGQADSIEQAFFAQADSQFTHHLQQFYAALLSTRHRPALEEKFGRQLFRVAENSRLISRPDLLNDLDGENRLALQYRDLVGHLPDQARPDPDRQLRRQTHLALAAHLESLSDPLDDLFDELVFQRKHLAVKLGFADFGQLADRRLERFDYDRGHLEIVRANVLRYVVPLTREIRRLQRRRLKIEHLAWYDLPCLLPEGPLQMQIDLNSLIGLTDQILADLSGQQEPQLQNLRDNGYLKLETAHAAPNGYTGLLLPRVGLPYLIVRSDTTGQTAAALLQAAGFALAAARSFENQQLFEYLQPAPELRMLAGTGLFLLALPYLEPVFGTGHDDFILLQLTEALLTMPFDCLVDDFEHRIYQKNDLNARQRRALWQELEQLYLPDLDYEQSPCFTGGGGWQLQRRIWQAPFSQINRTLSLLTALDLWRVSQNNASAAWRRYDRLLTLGGSDTTPGLLRQAGLGSPFDPDTIKKVAYAVCNHLSL